MQRRVVEYGVQIRGNYIECLLLNKNGILLFLVEEFKEVGLENQDSIMNQDQNRIGVHV